MIGANINAYFKAAMGYPVERLVAVMQGKDNSLPQAAAMMALQLKKPMIDAAKGQQAAQQPQQPSVKQQMEQEISMLPENVGVMNLPAPNMEKVGMASGGIVAFDEGGAVPGYAGDDGSWVIDPAVQRQRDLEWRLPILKQELLEAQQRGDEASMAAIQREIRRTVPAPSADKGIAALIPAAQAAEVTPTSAPTPTQATGASKKGAWTAQPTPQFQMQTERNPLRTPSMAKEEEARRAAALRQEGEAQTRAAQRAREQAEERDRQAIIDAESYRRRQLRREGKPVPTGPIDIPVSAPPVGAALDQSAAETARLLRQNKAADSAPTPFIDARGQGAPGAPAAPKAPAAGVAALPGAAKTSPFVPGKEGDLGTTLEQIKKYMPDAKAEYEGLGADVQKRYRELGEERERTKPQGKAMEGLEKLLTTEEAAAKDKEGKNLQMALISAGLAIAGGKSQYALQNIAEGAQVGTKQYMAGIEKLEEAAKERRRQAAAIEEARRAEARGDWKEAIQFKKEAADAELGIKKSQVEATMKITGESVKVAQDIVNNQNQIAARDRQLQEQMRVELEKQKMSDSAALERSKVMAGAYGGTKDPRNVADDNARAELDAWATTPAGKLASMDPKKYEEARRRIYNEVYIRAGLQPPFGGAGAGAGVNLSAEEQALINRYAPKK